MTHVDLLSLLPLWPIAGAFVLAALLAVLLTPAAIVIARRYHFVDPPNPRRQGPPKLRLGGVAMFLAFLLAVAAMLPFAPLNGPEDPLRVMGILIGALIVVIGGVIDDRWELPAGPQLLIQSLAALVAIAAGVVIQYVTNPFGERGFDTLVETPLWLAYPATLIWIVGAVNAINFIDGLDGLAAGIGLIAAALLTIHNLLFPSPLLGSSVLPAALAGACAGFLVYNTYPSRITMGTSGAAFLGFALGAFSILGVTKTATLLLVLGVPIIDTGWTILRRLAGRQSPFRGDRRHLHYRLADLGLSPRQIVGLLYVLSALPGALALLLPTPMLKLYAIVGLTGLMVIASVALTVADLRTLRARQAQSAPR